MKISVVIPVFNGLNFLGVAIDSVINQSHQDFEVIIVDDASEENIYKFIFDNYKTYLDCEKIRFFRNSINRERCYSRNLGIDEAKGELITFLDYDDRFKEDHLLTINEAFRNKSVQMVYSIPEELIDYKNEIVEDLKPKIKEEDLVESAALGGFCVIGLAFRKNVISEIGKFNLDTIQREDYELSCRAIIKHKLSTKIIKSNTIQIRRIKSDKFLTRSKRTEDPYLKFSKIAHKIVEEYMISAGEPKKYLLFSYVEIINTAISFDDYSYALDYLIKLFLGQPFLKFNFWLLGRFIKCFIVKKLKKVNIEIIL